MPQQREEETVVIFPFMAQGHIIPFLALALQIEERFGYKIIFVNTPQNIKKLHSSLPLNSSISFRELPFCSSDHGLPPDTENTDTLPGPLISSFLEASESLKPLFNQLMRDLTHEDKSPVCIIADMFFSWSVEIANELNIFHSIFITGCAYGFGVYCSLWLNLPHCKTDSDEFRLPDFPEVSSIHRSQLAFNLLKADGTDSWSKYLHKHLPLWFESDGIFLNTVKELDQTGLKYFRRKSNGRPVWPILPAFHHQKTSAGEDSIFHAFRPLKTSGVAAPCIEWLNNVSENSVLFVSFGSQSTITSSQMTELAIALEASGRNFIWVIRPPTEYDVTEEFRSEWLPKGYEAKIKEQNRGILVHKWAPQLEILSHKSTGAFLSHCGWNSILESLSHGVPILGWPHCAEQTYNSKLLEEELGVNMEVGRGTSCEIKHEDITRAIEIVMGSSKKGLEMRKNACKFREAIKDAIREEEDFKGSSVNAIEEFLKTALSMRKLKMVKSTNGFH